ncbi:nuclear transport factor 2 family protein [uncultured Acinetobacter sp.]|uniref:nuclear transport factor 2 family protein n=1 Tax=uncultured Acinetobacter sp. TaxID=165433 RepID=UPI002590705B|nr:nuclear transport factor 2 family protein [uncultured Acinetobacter sp.]
MNNPEPHIQAKIEHLIRYFAYLNDQKQYEELIQLFTENASYTRPSQPDQIILGKTDILDSFINRSQKKTQHVVGNILLDQQSPDLIISHSQIVLYSGLENQELDMIVVGGFNDKIILHQGRWYFNERRGFLKFKHHFTS